MNRSNLKKIWKRVKVFLRLKFLRKPSEKEILDLIRRLRPLDSGKELIRLGGERDGSYLVPDDLSNIEACFSPGVGGNSSFELDCANMGMKVFMADASVKGPVENHVNFQFIPKFIGDSTKKNFISLNRWIAESGISHHNDLLLQMDIEGYEYEVLRSLRKENLDLFRIIVVECHGLHRLDFPYYHSKMRKAFDRLLENHSCVHIHPNNFEGLKEMAGTAVPCAAEFTFLRNDRFSKRIPVQTLPHPLDLQNLPNREPVNLPAFWFGEDPMD